MLSAGIGQSGTVQPDFDPRESAEVTDRRFDAVVVGLGHDDPRFVRRVSPPVRARVPVVALALGIGLVATVLLGIVPLGLGLHRHSTALLATGGVGLLVLPLLVPVVVRVVVRRVRPLWA